jgi:uncharacterized protein (TIGR03000 family)
MYSVVLAAMLTAGGEAPAWCHGCAGLFHGCHGCWGCHGCRGCHGCWGCYGCSGCLGGGDGYAAAAAAASASMGSGAGSGSSGYYGYGSCFGCYGCYGVYGGLAYGGVAVARPVVAAVPVASVPSSVIDVAQSRPRVSDTTVAHVTVRLPADARLWVDGAACPLSSETRSFDTPTLESGKQYVYNLRAAVVRDGQTVEQTQRVVIAAGRQVNVTFGELNAASLTRR